MNRYLFLLLFSLMVLNACSESSSATSVVDTPVVTGTIEIPDFQQALIVLTDSWDSLQATMYAAEWRDSGWVVLRQHACVVGNNGLGWGSGVLDFTDRPGPVKHEGDKKSPAGIFTIGTAFGIFDEAALPALGVPYQVVEYELQCIEDTSSGFYNQLIREDDPRKDWEQNDRMTRKDHVYNLGAFVNHNTNPARPGDGSCIFLHLWRDDSHGTLGCTAMEQEKLLEHLQWLNLDKSPVLVQVPESEYVRISAEFGLPRL